MSGIAGFLASRPRTASVILSAEPAAPVEPPPVDLTDDYALIVLAAGDGPIRFWRFDGALGAPLVCSITEAEDAWVAPPAAVEQAQLPDTDTGGDAIDLGGVGYVQPAHVSGDDIAVGMICGWVRPSAASLTERAWLITKGGSAGDTPGRGRVIVRTNPPDSFAVIWRTGNTGWTTLTSTPGTAVAGEPAHIAIKADATGVSLYVNGVLEDAAGTHTIGLANNTEAWEFGRRTDVTPPTLSDVELDEWAVFNGPVSDDDILLLADAEAPAPSDEVGLAPAELYQPYTESDVDTVEVASMEALEAAFNAAPAGRNILVAPGTYTGGTRTFSASGAAGNPIVIRARDGYGTVTITGARWTFTGSRWVLSEMQFTDPGLTVDGGGQFGRITRNKFSGINKSAVQVRVFQNIRVDRNDVTEYASNTTTAKHFVHGEHQNVAAGLQRNILVDRNWIHDSQPALGNGFSEMIGYQAQNWQSANTYPGFWIERNLIQRVRMTSEGELVGAKVSGMVFWRNTVEDSSFSDTYLNVPRNAADFYCAENWFEGTTSIFMRVQGLRSVVIGNRFHGSSQMLLLMGNFYFSTVGSLVTTTPACEQAQIVGNIMGAAGTIRVGHQFAGTTLDVVDANLFGNTVNGGGDPITLVSGNHTGTTTINPGLSYTPAVKLTTADVGPAAA